MFHDMRSRLYSQVETVHVGVGRFLLLVYPAESFFVFLGFVILVLIRGRFLSWPLLFFGVVFIGRWPRWAWWSGSPRSTSAIPAAEFCRPNPANRLRDIVSSRQKAGFGSMKFCSERGSLASERAALISTGHQLDGVARRIVARLDSVGDPQIRHRGRMIVQSNDRGLEWRCDPRHFPVPADDRQRVAGDRADVPLSWGMPVAADPTIAAEQFTAPLRRR